MESTRKRKLSIFRRRAGSDEDVQYLNKLHEFQSPGRKVNADLVLKLESDSDSHQALSALHDGIIKLQTTSDDELTDIEVVDLSAIGSVLVSVTAVVPDGQRIETYFHSLLTRALEVDGNYSLKGESVDTGKPMLAAGASSFVLD